MNSRHWLSFVQIGFLLGALLLTGCGPQGPKVYPVKGTVTYNSQPLPEGDIVFSPTSPGEVEDYGKIKDGKFEFAARAGEKRVKITANRADGPIDPQMGVAPRRQYIPEKYSSAEKTELSATVHEIAQPAGGKNEFKFDLIGP
jgi:hypothetical protein